MGELVDQASSGLRRSRRGQVHLLEHRVAVADPPAGDHLEALGLGRRLGAAVGLEVADHDVAPALGLGLALLEHPVGLADAGGHAEEDLVVPASGWLHLGNVGACGLGQGEDHHAPSRLWTIRSISLIPMNGAMIPPSP